MKLRTALLAVILVLAAAALRAEELQVTISGFACTLSPMDCGTGNYTTPFTITYDIDSRSGQQTSSVGPDFGNPDEILGQYNARNLAVTNYSAIIGGQALEFAAHTTGFFEFEVEGPGGYDFAGAAGPSKGDYTFASFAAPTVTATEFATFQDPLASLLLKYRSTPSQCGACKLDTGSGSLDFFPLFGDMTITPVPAPGPLSLFLAGIVGLALSRRRKQLDPSPSPS